MDDAVAHVDGDQAVSRGREARARGERGRRADEKERGATDAELDAVVDAIAVIWERALFPGGPPG